MRKTSEIIRERIRSSNSRFHSNDNISDFIEEGELTLLQSEVEERFQDVLDALIIDTENDHNTQETAKRVAKMFINETFGDVMHLCHGLLHFLIWAIRVCIRVVLLVFVVPVHTTSRISWATAG